MNVMKRTKKSTMMIVDRVAFMTDRARRKKKVDEEDEIFSGPRFIPEPDQLSVTLQRRRRKQRQIDETSFERFSKEDSEASFVPQYYAPSWTQGHQNRREAKEYLQETYQDSRFFDSEYPYFTGYSSKRCNMDEKKLA